MDRISDRSRPLPVRADPRHMPPDYYLDQIDWLTAFQRGLTIAADVTDADTIFVAAEQVIERWGELDLWVNNAMVTMFAPVSDLFMPTPPYCT